MKNDLPERQNICFPQKKFQHRNTKKDQEKAFPHFSDTRHDMLTVWLRTEAYTAFVLRVLHVSIDHFYIFFWLAAEQGRNFWMQKVLLLIFKKIDIIPARQVLLPWETKSPSNYWAPHSILYTWQNYVVLVNSPFLFVPAPCSGKYQKWGAVWCL